jgi:hypothetical protein
MTLDAEGQASRGEIRAPMDAPVSPNFFSGGTNLMSILSIRLVRASCACLMSAALISCGGGSNDEPKDIPFARVQGDFFGDWPVQTYMARTDSEWTRVWNLFVPNFPPAPKPVVDFSANTVVGISLGWGSSGCEGLAISRVTEKSAEIDVEYHRSSAPTGQGCTTGVVPLVDFVEISTTTKPIVFSAP